MSCQGTYSERHPVYLMQQFAYKQVASAHHWATTLTHTTRPTDSPSPQPTSQHAACALGGNHRQRACSMEVAYRQHVRVAQEARPQITLTGHQGKTEVDSDLYLLIT